MWAVKVGKPTVLQGLCWKGEVGIAFLILRRLLQKINYDSDTHSEDCALLPVHDLFVAWLEVNTGISRKLETQNHLYCCDIHPQDGWDPEHPGDQCECCTMGVGEGHVAELHTSHAQWIID